ncbi:hypothetical protein ACP70R_044071 [Stipagrostis hirtigluma subsp. patula]
MYDELHDAYKLAMSKVRDDYIICWLCFMESEGSNKNAMSKDKLASHNTKAHRTCDSSCDKCGRVFYSEGEVHRSFGATIKM